MPSVITISSAEISRIKNGLAGVATNGQALAAVDASLQAAFNLGNVLLGQGGPFREQAAKDIREVADRLQKVRGQLDGAAAAKVGNTWTSTVKAKVFDLWTMILTIQAMYPPDADFGDGWTDAVKDSLEHFEENINLGAQKIGKVVGAIAGGAANVAGNVTGNVVWEFLKKAWPVVLIAGGALVLILVARKKLDKVI
jgi:hypothetical protein